MNFYLMLTHLSTSHHAGFGHVTQKLRGKKRKHEFSGNAFRFVGAKSRPAVPAAEKLFSITKTDVNEKPVFYVTVSLFPINLPVIVTAG